MLAVLALHTDQDHKCHMLDICWVFEIDPDLLDQGHWPRVSWHRECGESGQRLLWLLFCDAEDSCRSLVKRFDDLNGCSQEATDYNRSHHLMET